MVLKPDPKGFLSKHIRFESLFNLEENVRR